MLIEDAPRPREQDTPTHTATHRHNHDRTHTTISSREQRATQRHVQAWPKTILTNHKTISTAPTTRQCTHARAAHTQPENTSDGRHFEPEHTSGERRSTTCMSAAMASHPTLGRRSCSAKAAAPGHSGAQCALGLCDHHGEGVLHNAKRAAELLTEPAAQGEPRAQRLLRARLPSLVAAVPAAAVAAAEGDALGHSAPRGHRPSLGHGEQPKPKAPPSAQQALHAAPARAARQQQVGARSPASHRDSDSSAGHARREHA